MERVINQLKEDYKESNVWKKVLAVLGGINVVVEVATPIFIGLFWIRLAGLTGFGSYLLFIVCLLATLFRAIRVGFMK